MKFVFAFVALAVASVPALALAPPAPEIDGSMAIQFVALAGGLALLFKKKR